MLGAIGRIAAAAAVLVACVLPVTAVAQSTAILVQDSQSLPSGFAVEHSGGRDVVWVNPGQLVSCQDFDMAVQGAIASRTISAVISLWCDMRSLATNFPGVLFITGSEGQGGDGPANLLQLLLPPAVGEVSAASRERFGLSVPVTLCGGSEQWTNWQTFFSCLVAPEGTDLALTLEQLHYLAAVKVLDEIAPVGVAIDPSQARSQVANHSYDTALGALSFGDGGAATAAMQMQLTWNQSVRPDNPPAQFSNASSDDIMTFLRDSIGPASAAISKVCDTTCPTQCNGTCQTEDGKKCCSVASEDPQP